MGFSWTRAATWLVAGVVGLVYGTAGTIAHAYSLLGLPVGLVLGLVGSAALLVSIRLLTQDRWSALVAGFGMMLTTLVFSGRGPGGSVVVPDSGFGIVWTLALPLVIGLVVAWPRIPERRAVADGEGDRQAN